MTDSYYYIIKPPPGPPRGRIEAGPMTAAECRAWIRERRDDWELDDSDSEQA